LKEKKRLEDEFVLCLPHIRWFPFPNSNTANSEIDKGLPSS
jgi:hypothetical protein